MKRSPIRRKTPLRRSPSRRRPGGSKTKIPGKVRAAVELRDRGMCQIRSGNRCEGRGYHCHHLLPRSAGGKHVEENLVLTCVPCHVYLHQHPGESYERGWLRRRTVDNGQGRP